MKNEKKKRKEKRCVSMKGKSQKLIVRKTITKLSI